MKQRVFLGLIALLTLAGLIAPPPPSTRAASFDVLGVRLIREGDFYGNKDYTKSPNLPRLDVGGRLQVHIKNTGTDPLSITGFEIDGKSFSELTTQETSSPHVDDTKWWRAWPNPVPPGKVTTISLRMTHLDDDMPNGNSFVIKTDQGDTELTPPAFDPAPSPLWMLALNVSADLDTLTIFAANRGSEPITLKGDGGVAINGINKAGTLPQTTLAAGDVVPITVSGTKDLLTVGEHTIFSLTPESGASATSAGLRVFPYTFTVQSHMQGSNYDEEDRAHHFVGDWDYWFSELLDEPSGKGWTPMKVVGELDKWLNEDPEATQERPVTIHNTSHMEGLVYDDIAGIANSHWGNVRQDLSTFVTRPKPNWYMPQNTWGHNEGMYKRESWGSLEDIQFQAFQAVGRGAKSIQWFLFQNHWRQGWDRKEGTDFARAFQDKYRNGHVSNPITWNRVGRTSGVLHILTPYLSNSAHYHHERTDDGIEVNTLVSVNREVEGTHKAVVALMDHRTPRTSHTAGHLFKYDVPAWNQQVLHDQSISVLLPEYLYNEVDHAYAIDPWLGVQELTLSKNDGNRVSFTIPQVQTGAMVVLGTTADKTTLDTAWQTVGTSFDTYDDVRTTSLARARPVPADPWRFAHATYRDRITIRNQSSSALEHIALPINMTSEREYNVADIRVVEIEGDNATEVPFLLEGTKEYETFENNPLDRFVTDSCYGSVSPDGCDRRFESNNGVLSLYSAYKKAGFAWSTGLKTEAQAIPWMTDEGYEDRWIPARFTTFAVEANIGEFPWWNWNKIVFYMDRDNDGEIDKTRGFQVNAESDIRYELEDGWIRYIFNMNNIFGHELVYPGEDIVGQYRIAFEQQLLPDRSEEEGEEHAWHIRRVIVMGNEAIIKPATPIAADETRTYEIYYDVKENSRAQPSSHLDPTLLNADLPSEEDIAIVSHQTERAGVSAQTDNTNVSLHTQSEVNKLLVQHLGRDGTIVSANTLTSDSSTQEFNVTLTRPLLATEILACSPIQPGGEGHLFTFNSAGQPISGNAQTAMVQQETWKHSLPELFAQEDEQGIFPFTVDISPDGTRIAAGVMRLKDDRSDTTGIVRLFNAQGEQEWEKTYNGRVFFVRFTPDGQSLYVAANRGEDQIDPNPPDWSFKLYEDLYISKYTLSGEEQWKHKIGSGVPDFPSDKQGRTIYDMDVYPNGDLLYGEWNTFGVKLNGEDGQVEWGVKTGDEGIATYTTDVTALDDGGALLHGFYAKHVKPDGTVRNFVFVSSEPRTAIGGSSDASVWAFTGNVLRIMKDIPEGVNYRISGEGSNMETLEPGLNVGRYPRVVDVTSDGSRVAVGTSDGRFTMLSSDGDVQWEQHDGTSYITQIGFLPNDEGVVFARDIFDYQHEHAAENIGWRYRDVVEAYTLDGSPLWRHEGQWRDTANSEPFMTRFALNSDATRLAVLSGEEVRLVDLTSDAMANSYLYPTEDRIGTGDIDDPSIGTPTKLQISGPTWGIVNEAQTFTSDIAPTTASVPITYTWQVSDHDTETKTLRVRSAGASYTWETTGTKQLAVEAINKYGTVDTTHDILISDPPSTSINHDRGQVGSHFVVSGTNFPPNTVISINVAGIPVGSVQTDAQGAFVAQLDTEGQAAGSYTVELATTAGTAMVERQLSYTLEDSGTVHPPDSSIDDTFKTERELIYLPIVVQ